MTKTKEAILNGIFLFGGILLSDLERVLKVYSKNPKKYIQKLREGEDLELEKKTNLLYLAKSTKKQIANKQPLWKFKNNQITNHDLISFEVLFYFLINQEVKTIEIEKDINNTSLRSDMVITTNNQTYFIELDNGTERQKEIESKINQYRLNLKGILLFVSISTPNIKIVQNLALDDPSVIILSCDKIQELHSLLVIEKETLDKVKENTKPVETIEYNHDIELMKLVQGFQ